MRKTGWLVAGIIGFLFILNLLGQEPRVESQESPTPDPTQVYIEQAIQTAEAVGREERAEREETPSASNDDDDDRDTPTSNDDEEDEDTNGMTAEYMEEECEGEIDGDLMTHEDTPIGCRVPDSIDLFDGACVDYDPRSTEIDGDHELVYESDNSNRAKITEGNARYVGEYPATVYWTPCTKP